MMKEEKLQEAQRLYKTANADQRYVLESLFPELAESEDEKIRKWIIDDIRYNMNNEPLNNSEYKKQAQKALAWLEKQGNTDETIDRDKFAQGILRGAAINLITWIDYNAAEGNTCLSNMECKDIEDALVKGDWNKIYAYMKKKLERQDEQKSIFDFNANNWYVSKVDGKIHNIYNSGVEPKFHKDEWVVNNATLNLCHILRVEHGQYICDDCSFPITKENEYHLWTIQDAKDGDVLAFSNDIVVIFKDLYNSSSFHSYCHIEDGEFGISEDDMPDWWEGKGFQPATKEQRDHLFEKMHEEGYEWDEEKKELKRIEDEEYDGEDYGIDSLFHAQRILEKTLGTVNGYQTDDGILSHKCAITAVKKLYEQKPAEWSDEDECYMGECISAIASKDSWSFEEKRKTKHWLESIKQRWRNEL